MPLKGVYDGYGFPTKIQRDWNTAGILSTFQRLSENGYLCDQEGRSTIGNFHTIDAFIQAVERGSVCVKPSGCAAEDLFCVVAREHSSGHIAFVEALPVSFMLLHEETWQAAIQAQGVCVCLVLSLYVCVGCDIDHERSSILYFPRRKSIRLGGQSGE